LRLLTPKAKKTAAGEYAKTQQREQMATERMRHAIIRNIFQALIVGSGIDWAQPQHADLAATLQLLGDDDGVDEGYA
jgi:hypothetical protein